MMREFLIDYSSVKAFPHREKVSLVGTHQPQLEETAALFELEIGPYRVGSSECRFALGAEPGSFIHGPPCRGVAVRENQG
jgi:hypothetical protein